jgi:hypothetical protein
MKSIIDKPFGLLAIFVALLGLELFVFYLLVVSGLLPTLLAEDYSFISRVILVIYLGASLHVMLVSYYLSIESNDLNAGSPRRSTRGKRRIGRITDRCARRPLSREIQVWIRGCGPDAEAWIAWYRDRFHLHAGIAGRSQ